MKKPWEGKKEMWGVEVGESRDSPSGSGHVSEPCDRLAPTCYLLPVP